LTTIPAETEKELRVFQEATIIPILEKVNGEVAEVFTTEQKQKYIELLIATMSVHPFLGASMFDALDLTDEQRLLLKMVKEELEPEYERMIDQVIDDAMWIEKTIQAALGDLLQDISQEDRGKKVQEAVARLTRENPEFKKKTERVVKQGREFHDRHKVQMFDVLTDEQMAKLARLVNNPPDALKKIVDKMKAALGEQEKSAVWMPGPNSWQPGDPLPEGYLQVRQERRGRGFPREELKTDSKQE
jgi:hypothetical protein